MKIFCKEVEFFVVYLRQGSVGTLALLVENKMTQKACKFVTNGSLIQTYAGKRPFAGSSHRV